VVTYLFIGLAECSVDPKISRGARKLTRTSQVIYIKKLSQLNNWKLTILHKDEQLITFCRFEVLYVVEMSDLTEEITSTRYYFIIISNQKT
jgi:hypothetical protein